MCSIMCMNCGSSCDNMPLNEIEEDEPDENDPEYAKVVEGKLT